jgi:hypothetical protein
VAAVLAAASAPAALPWLLADRELAPAEGSPARMLVAVYGPAAPGEASESALLAGERGIAYALDVGDAGRPLEALLAPPAGDPLVPLLVRRGYATAAVVADGSLGPDVGAVQRDARPGARARVSGDLRWVASGPWLAGPARRVFERLGLGDAARTPEQLASAARGWLLQHGGSATPFFLLVDLRHREPRTPAELARDEAVLDGLLDHLDQSRLGERTLVLLARAGHPGERQLRALLRPPLAWRAASAEPLARPVRASELAAALEEIARGDVSNPVSLPGVASAWPRGAAQAGVAAAGPR